jgi:hypothetical protein
MDNDAAIRAVLAKIVNFASPAGKDSTGAEVVKVRRALLDEARDLLSPSGPYGSAR